MTRTFWAPGRVNLIGDHTDYSGGLVLPAAIDRGLTLRAEAAERIVLSSAGQHDAVDVAADGTPAPSAGWGRYVAAVAGELAALGRPAVGLRGSITSNLPTGAGLSSSAALEVLVGVALCAVADFEIAPLELAAACQRAEQRAVGVPCGIMDQAASLLGEEGAAVLLDCGSLDHRLVPLPRDLAVVIVDSGVGRRLEDSGYARRRAELEEGLALIGGRAPSTVNPAELADLLRGDDSVPARRLRHVVTENDRVRRTVATLTAGSLDREALGTLFADSHASLRSDFEVTVPATDALVSLCVQAGAVAARMTGGGFGGAVVALVPAEGADGFGSDVVDAYRHRFPDASPAVHHCDAAAGAGELTT